jgi:hypothetical protein
VGEGIRGIERELWVDGNESFWIYQLDTYIIRCVVFACIERLEA